MNLPPLDNRGVALLLAVAVISLLMALTVQFNRDMRQELTSAANALDVSRLGIMTKSAANLAGAALVEDWRENQFDTSHDRWAVLKEQNLEGLSDDGSFSVAVEDLSGRFQVNSLVPPSGQGVNAKSSKILERMLESGTFGDLAQDQVEEIIQALIDWIDTDDQEVGGRETESSYYLAQQPSYSARNGPMEFIEELLLVRGITPELYRGTDQFPGLREVLTVHGDDGKININTAPPEVLKALGEGITDQLVDDLLKFRRNLDNRVSLQNTNWYANIIPGTITIDPDTITTKSSYFRIRAAAKRSGMERSLRLVVEREKDGSVKEISRKVE